ncbi:MAG: hypothetical protein H6841_02710 [Planctomycetes bacterium]|nr:hypothetical protein [Planctomycetota bacterium]MCB9936337.1 hypothetical protein [Planctomycetota bacterium]
MSNKNRAFKVLVRGELKGPFKETSIINGIRSGMVPLSAKLLDMATNEYIQARELVDETRLDYDNTIPLFDGDF